MLKEDVEYQIKQVDLQLKKRDLEDRSGWKRLKHPAVAAALITGWVALASGIGSGIFGWVSSSTQARVELKKFQDTIVLNILQENEPSYVPARNEEMRKQRIRIAIESGIIADENGSICRAFVGEGCPIKVLRAKEQ